MSLQLSDTDNLKGIAQIYEKEIGANQGDITGNTAKMKAFVADVNLAMDDFQDIAIKASGMWGAGDSNHTKYSIVLATITSGQRDYNWTTDEQGNLILDLYRVAVADSSGVFRELEPVDQQILNNSNTNTDSFIDGQNATGVPTRYDKTDNALFLDPIPNYTRAESLKMLVSRESSYFVYTDTAKKPGVPGLLHRYFAIKPALDYARRNNLANYTTLAKEVLSYEGDEDRGIVGKIAREYGRREKDIKRRIVPSRENNK